MTLKGYADPKSPEDSLNKSWDGPLDMLCPCYKCESGSHKHGSGDQMAIFCILLLLPPFYCFEEAEKT